MKWHDIRRTRWPIELMYKIWESYLHIMSTFILSLQCNIRYYTCVFIFHFLVFLLPIFTVSSFLLLFTPSKSFLILAVLPSISITQEYLALPCINISICEIGFSSPAANVIFYFWSLYRRLEKFDTVWIRLL